MGKFNLTVISLIAFLASACSGSSVSSGSTTASAASTTSTSTLSVSPTTYTIVEGGTYTFLGSGGTGTYTYSLPEQEGSIGYYTGVYVAPTGWTGNTYVLVTDSSGATAEGVIIVTSTSSTSSSSSITGTLGSCAGQASAYLGGVNNWQLSGTEMRTVNDGYNYTESPINCTGLSIAGQIPSNATITGISVSIFLINQESYSDGYLESVAIINSGSVIGSAQTVSLAIPGNQSTFPTHTVGASGNLWGGAPTAAQVNSSTFGVSIQTFRQNNRQFLGANSGVQPQVTIYYTL